MIEHTQILESADGQLVSITPRIGDDGQPYLRVSFTDGQTHDVDAREAIRMIQSVETQMLEQTFRRSPGDDETPDDPRTGPSGE